MKRLACIVLLITPALHAQERLVRHFGPEQGLPAPAVVALAQDRVGFLWIGTASGVYRYDGLEMRRWAPALNHVQALAASSDGRVVAIDDWGHLVSLDAKGATPLAGSPDSLRAITFVGDTLWVARGPDVLRQFPDGRWDGVVARLDAPGRALHPNGAGGVDAATRHGVWTVTPGQGARQLFALERVFDVLRLPDERRFAITGDGHVFEWAHDRLAERFALKADGRALVLRGDVVWASFDRFIAAIHPDGPIDVLGAEQGVDGGGPLIVDHEGSLWVGTYAALLQLPEPETTWWGERQGFPSSLARYVGETGGIVWVTTWGGLGRLAHDTRGWHATTPGVLSVETVWRDTVHDELVVSSSKGLYALHHDTAMPTSGPGLTSAPAFARAPDGGLWVGSEGGLYHATADGHRLRRIPDVPFDGVTVAALTVDSTGKLWAGSGNRICAAAAQGLLTGTARWACDTIADALEIMALFTFPSGNIWMATRGHAILRRARGGQRWEPLPGTRALPSAIVLNLIPARSPGTVWVAAFGAVVRVVERPDTPDGWQILEQLGGWHGLPGRGANDVLEEADGTVWLTTARGVMRVPGTARYAPRPPPPVALVDARVDTAEVPLGSALVLPHQRNRLELRFAALSLRDPGPIRYQVRLSRGANWQDTRGLPSFRWIDLPPGRYRAEVRASADGHTWTPEPAAFVFTVRPPWYREPWAIAVFALAFAIGLTIAYRARVEVLLGLERQRARIAMDLHDEIGSALGSIGILSGVLAQDRAANEEGERIAREISRTAGEVGDALSGLVWALDPRPGTLRDLATRLADYGERLFASDHVEFRTRFPTAWPADLLPLELRGNVVAVGLEALHNAARHARAKHVTLTLEPQGAKWELAVSDDGIGLAAPKAAGQGAGLGLRSMQRRAQEIAGSVTWEATPGGGTTLRLSFALQRRSWWARLRRHVT